jgi:hypothetical protein
LFSAKLAEGKARLDFARPENRELWLAGYHYIRSLIMKGTYRTALEWAKLLLALDPEDDPYCMRLWIHQLALKAHDGQFVIDLAATKLFRETHKASIKHTIPSLAYAYLQKRDGVESRKYLSEAMQQVPWLFTRLFQELNLDSPPPSIWGAQPRTDSEKLFTEIYIRQTKDLWNSPEATSLLMEVGYATEKLDEVPINDEGVTLDVARFVYLDNTPALMSLVPSSLLHRIPNSDSDPLPPDHNLFSWPSQRLPFERAENSRGGRGDDYMDPIAALARLLPGLRRNGNPETGEQIVVDDELRQQLEVAAAEAEEAEQAETEDGGDPPAPRSWLDPRNLLDLIWGTRQPADVSTQSVSSEDAAEDESEHGSHQE